MRIIEAEGKKLMSMRGLQIPSSIRLYGPDDVIDPIPGDVVVKGQNLSGKRAEAGLIAFADSRNGSAALEKVRLAMTNRGEVPYVLVEEKISIEAEYYLAWRIDDLTQGFVLMFSAEGGTDIEERGLSIAQYEHSPLLELHPHMLGPFLSDCGIPNRSIGPIARFAATLLRVFREEDATLIEINPLVVTEAGRVVAADAKVVLDDNARHRHGDWRGLVSRKLQDRDKTPLERKAANAGFTFVELDGGVAVFSAGAGLGMCILDMLCDADMPAANFADASGGSGGGTFGQLAEIVFELAAKPEVEAILFFFVLSATSLKGVVESVTGLIDQTTPGKPVVFGLQAAGAAERELSLPEARAALEARGIVCVSALSEAIDALRELGIRRAKSFFSQRNNAAGAQARIADGV
jgi:succinyl-CoA synthetase beta subunit